MPQTRLALDVAALQNPAAASGDGVADYVAGLAEALVRAGVVDAVLADADQLARDPSDPWAALDSLARLDSLATLDSLVTLDSRRAARRLVRGADAAGAALVRLVTDAFAYTRTGDPAGLVASAYWAASGAAHAAILHDVPDLGAPPSRARSRAEWLSLADVILVPSEQVGRRAIERLGLRADAVRCIGAGVATLFSPDPATRTVAGGRETAEIFVPSAAGAARWADTVCQAVHLETRGREADLVLAGAMAPADERIWLEAASRQGLGGHLILAGRLDRVARRDRYRRAILTIALSDSGARTVDALESAACGTPALVVAPAPEASAATPEAFWKPAGGGSLARRLAPMLTDPWVRSRVLRAQRDRARTSTWDRVAEQAVAAIEEAVVPASERRRRPGTGPLGPAVLLAGPLPPLGGGLGRYNASFAGAVLDAGGTVDTLEWATDRPPARAGRLSFEAIGRDATYDCVLYTLGNSAGHLRTVDMALRHPGWLWLHETRLPAIATSALDEVDEAEFAGRIARLLELAYPGRPPLDAARAAGRDHLALAGAGIGLAAPLVERSVGVLVNSEAARHALLVDLRPLAAPPPICVLPPACPPVRPRRYQPDGDCPTVVAFGMVSMSKRPDLLVDAVAQAGCRLAFVGPCPPILAQVISTRASQRDAGELVTVTGEVDDDAYWAWMDRAALAVQLRDHSSGEMSASVLDALAAGVPVLTNLPSAWDYPEGTVAIMDDPAPETVAAHVLRLLDDADARQRLAEAGQRFAAAHQMADLVAAVMKAVES